MRRMRDNRTGQEYVDYGMGFVPAGLGAIVSTAQFVRPVAELQEFQPVVCSPGYYQSGNTCVPIPPCPQGYGFSPASGRCEPSYVSAPADLNSAVCTRTVANPNYDSFDPSDSPTQKQGWKTAFNPAITSASKVCKSSGADAGYDCLTGNCCYLTTAGGQPCYCKNKAGKWTSSNNACCTRACSASEKSTILG